MTIAEICNMLRNELLNNGYEYGFYLDGRKYKPDFSQVCDCEYSRLANTIYRIQPPLVTMREKIGTCLETVLVMHQLLEEQGISSKIWLLYSREKNRPHTILTFEADERIVYLELTPQSAKPCYGREIVFSDEQEFLAEFDRSGSDVYDVTDMIAVGQSPAALLAGLV